MNGIELHDVLAGDDRGVKTPAAELDTNEESTVPKNTRDGATIDAMADLVLRDAALCELNELMSAMLPRSCTASRSSPYSPSAAARRNGSTRSSGHRPRYSNWSDRREATAPRRRRNHLGLARVSLVVGTAPDSPRGGPNGVLRSYCPGRCKLIFAPAEAIESCTVSTPSLEVPGGTSNDTTA
jgi:hypothetical protein